jgi:DNA primase
MSRATDRKLVEAALRGSMGRGEWRRVNCPVCPAKLNKVDRKFGMSVNAFSGYYECHRCGTRGFIDPFEDGPEERTPSPETVAPPPGYLPLYTDPALTADAARPARRYLTKRGVTPEMVQLAQIGVVLEGYYADRVVIPVLAPDGEDWLGWVSRSWHKDVANPYLNAKGMRRTTLFNHRALGVKTDTPLLVVEGAFDALALWPDGVAVLGKPTPEQLDSLAMCIRPVVFVLDGDAKDEARALAISMRLRGHSAGAVELDPCVDPDEVDKSWLQQEAVRSLTTSLF